MNIVTYSRFRLFFVVSFFGFLFGWGGFVAMEDQVIAFYEQEPSYNTFDDSSLQKYVGNGEYLTYRNYVPGDLLPIDSNFTANNSKSFSLREEAGKQFADLARHFWNHFGGDKLYITSAYRSAYFQELLFKRGCPRTRCAEVGTSEHQLGLAIDLGVMTKGGRYIALSKGNKYYQWLLEYGADWGFHNSYQKGLDIDGQMQEGRHWRYLGYDLAKKLYENEQTFSEWYSLQKQMEI